MRTFALIMWIMGALMFYSHDFKCPQTLENRVAVALAGALWPVLIMMSVIRQHMDRPAYVYRCVEGEFKAVERLP